MERDFIIKCCSEWDVFKTFVLFDDALDGALACDNDCAKVTEKVNVNWISFCQRRQNDCCNYTILLESTKWSCR